MKPDQDLYDITSQVLLNVRSVLKDFAPDLVLVHGDTTTTLATALACYYQKIKVGHIEAGLRTYNPLSPWPEEMNRQLADRLCAFHFAPTEVNAENLRQEHIPSDHICVTGNTVIDSLHFALEKIKSTPPMEADIIRTINKAGYPSSFTLHPSQDQLKLILVTGHRRENFGEGFIQICEALNQIAIQHPEVDIVYPVHLNPNVREPVYHLLQNKPNIYLIEPLEYLPFVYLMNRSYLILTDSGGIQEEAPGLGKPVLVMRDTTERPEGIEAGTVRLVGTKINSIVSETHKLLTDEKEYFQMSRAHNPYGDGKACRRIADYLSHNL
jgi:UDP-N-acetylglucosamine 2-epimerase (non-hydrolysing)